MSAVMVMMNAFRASIDIDFKGSFIPLIWQLYLPNICQLFLIIFVRLRLFNNWLWLSFHHFILAVLIITRDFPLRIELNREIAGCYGTVLIKLYLNYSLLIVSKCINNVYYFILSYC
jgi:hypothetical protein